MENFIIVGSQMRESVKSVLGKNKRLIELMANPRLPVPVAAHPDMQILIIDGTAVLTRSLYESSRELSDVLDGRMHIEYAENEHTNVYPGDVGLNAFQIEGHIIGKLDSLDSTLKHICIEKNIKTVNVRQGYAKCSTLVLDRAVITADIGIADTVRALGFDALLIGAGHIRLDGYDYGFIGGSSHYSASERTVYFFGNIDLHPDGGRIKTFLNEHRVEYVSCDRDGLTDYGGAVCI